MGARAVIVVTAVGVLLGALGAGALFNSLFFQRFLVNIADARLLAVAQDTRDVFARSVALGLPLNQFEGGALVVEQARRVDPAITGVRIFQVGQGGFTSLGLGGDAAGAPLPEGWAQAMNRAPAATFWPVEDDSGFGVLVPIHSSFGKVVGLTAILQARSALAASKARFDVFLGGIAVAIGLPAALGLALAMAALTRPGLARLPQWAAHAEGRAAAPDHAASDLVGALVAEPMEILRERRGS